MGYRHQVTIAVYDKDYENIKNLCSARLYDLAQIYEYRNMKIFNWNWIKWNKDTFSSVPLVENYISQTDAIFIRVGEDITDCEEIRYGNDSELKEVIYLRRVIEIEGTNIKERRD